MSSGRGPILKRAKALGVHPSELGIDKETRRNKDKVLKKESEYAKQLKEKQKVKFTYGVREKQFRLYYDKAERMRGQTGENMLILLERRLDNVVYRLGLAKTRAMARQVVVHAQLLVNGKPVDRPSYLVKKGDIIAVKETKKQKGNFEVVKELKVALPKWLEFNKDELTGKVVELPERSDITQDIQEHLIVELYSK